MIIYLSCILRYQLLLFMDKAAACLYRLPACFPLVCAQECGCSGISVMGSIVFAFLIA